MGDVVSCTGDGLAGEEGGEDQEAELFRYDFGGEGRGRGIRAGRARPQLRDQPGLREAEGPLSQERAGNSDGDQVVGTLEPAGGD